MANKQPPIKPTKPRGESRVFELLNLERIETSERLRWTTVISRQTFRIAKEQRKKAS